MWTVIATFLNHGDAAYRKEHGICANSRFKYKFYTTTAIQLNVPGQVPNLVKLSFLFYNIKWVLGKIKNKIYIYKVFSYVSSTCY